MSQLNRNTSQFNPEKYDQRPLAPEHVDTAKTQAYLLRDLISKCLNVNLTGGNITDCFSLLYHGQDWSSLMAKLRGSSDQDYFASTGKSINQQCTYLDALLVDHNGNLPADRKGSSSKVLLGMPRDSYKSARTHQGAKIATLIEGAPAWDINQNDCTLYEAETDLEFHPISFHSDPITNEEQLRVKMRSTGKVTDLPLSNVRFVKYSKHDVIRQEDDHYHLTGHAYPETRAKSFYKTALDYPLARRWFNRGNDIRVMRTEGGTGLEMEKLSEWRQEGKDDFDQSLAFLRRTYSCNIILLPLGLNDVRDPEEELFGATYKRTKALLPEVKKASSFYDKIFDTRVLEMRSGDDFTKLLNAATVTYNKTLAKAVNTLWLDTQEVNSKSLTEDFYLSKKPNETHIDKHNAFEKLCEIIGVKIVHIATDAQTELGVWNVMGGNSKTTKPQTELGVWNVMGGNSKTTKPQINKKGS
jgi:hypothetical protein